MPLGRPGPGAVLDDGFGDDYDDLLDDFRGVLPAAVQGLERGAGGTQPVGFVHRHVDDGLGLSDVLSVLCLWRD